MVMSWYKAAQIFVITLLLVVGFACGDPDKSGNNPTVTPPTVASVGPITGSVGACPNAVITATFGKAMNPDTINMSTFTLTGPGNASIGGQAGYNSSSKTATFTPSATLALNTMYTATITTGARDLYGNTLATSFVWTFTTGNAVCVTGPPTVVTVLPAVGASGVCQNTTVLATFGEAMNPATINSTTFTVTGPSMSAVTGQVSYDALGRGATFTPSANLALNTMYTATITTGAQNLFGTGLTTAYVWTFTTVTVACGTPAGPPLGSAAIFEVLAGSTVTNTGPTIISGGDVGLSPGSAVTGFPPGTLTTPAVMHITDPTAAQAELDLTTAYLYTAGLPAGAVLPGDLSGLTFAPGVYTNSSTVQLLSGNVTLDAQGNANAVFIFQVGSTITTLAGTQVILANNAQASNVFWETGSSATLGTNSIFMGTIMSLQSITLNTGATLTGRALARNGAVTLDSNIVTAPSVIP
jgi:hypothetical protein